MHPAIIKKNIAKSFARAAASYDKNCELQHRVASELMSFFEPPMSISTALDVGCGTGVSSQLLQHYFSIEQTFAIDIAQPLLKQAITKPDLQSMSFLQADFDQTPFANNSFDCVISSMALQWSCDLVKTLIELKRIVRQRGRLVISLPLVGTCFELAMARAKLPQQASAHFSSQPELETKFSQVGFEIQKAYAQRYVYQFPTLQALLTSIKGVGASYLHHRKRNLSTRAYFSKLEKNYFRVNNQFPLTYHIGYFDLIC